MKENKITRALEYQYARERYITSCGVVPPRITCNEIVPGTYPSMVHGRVRHVRMCVRTWNIVMVVHGRTIRTSTFSRRVRRPGDNTICCDAEQYRAPTDEKKQENWPRGWISYWRMGAFYTNFSIITTPEFLISYSVLVKRYPGKTSACLFYWSFFWL